MTENSHTIDWNDFSKIEMRVGTIISAEVFKEAKKPAYKIVVDFGAYGIRKSSAQITDLYQPENIVGKQVIAVINFPPKQIATIKSECLILGAIGATNEVTLLTTERPVENGLRIG
jgi:tRNA-binding protein